MAPSRLKVRSHNLLNFQGVIIYSGGNRTYYSLKYYVDTKANCLWYHSPPKLYKSIKNVVQVCGC